MCLVVVAFVVVRELSYPPPPPIPQVQSVQWHPYSPELLATGGYDK